MRDSFFEWLFGPDGKAVVAGSAGGLLRWLTSKSSPRDGMISILAGALCAVYLGPLGVPVIDALFGRVLVDEDARNQLAGFIMGLSGISISSMITDIFTARLAQLKGKKQPDSDSHGGADDAAKR